MKDITLAGNGNSTTIRPTNALGQRVLKANLPGTGDFSVLGAPVEVKLPLDIVRSLIRGRGATFTAKGAA
jgi:hypothetical protein